MKIAKSIFLLMMLPAMTACSTTHVEVLASTYHDLSRSFDEEAREYQKLGEIVSPGRHIVVTPISDDSRFEPSLAVIDIPNQTLIGDNPRQLDDKIQAARGTFHDALRDLANRKDGNPRTEIIDAIIGSERRFAVDRPGTKKVLVILSSGYEQSGVINMNTARGGKISDAPTIELLKKQGRMPSLPQVKVCMGAISRGIKPIADMEQFWSGFFQAAGATLVSYGPSIPSQCFE